MLFFCYKSRLYFDYSNNSFSKILCNPKLRWYFRMKWQLFLFLKMSRDTLNLKLNIKWSLSNIIKYSFTSNFQIKLESSKYFCSYCHTLVSCHSTEYSLNVDWMTGEIFGHNRSKCKCQNSASTCIYGVMFRCFSLLIWNTVYS